jgi:hypothetical protein
MPEHALPVIIGALAFERTITPAMSPATVAKEQQQNLNVRVPRGQWAMLKQIGDQLDLSLNTVVAAILHWNLAAAQNQEAWTHAVETLRGLVDEDDRGMMLYDFDDSEWHDRLRNYESMRDIGLIDALKYRRSTSTHRWLCSFALTACGRVIASVLKGRIESEGASELGEPAQDALGESA